ncbi:hypothetical protein O181_006950 [Austropuccinia psidii MF-1]|uniref:Uncharacterized protein n=1 Tax=Austropuccinia psidii MF-1 TaxID=1389203 RepID=A0A9Q3BLZ4_9BASI|nr:hypothetical protein [Austropuccinia psidii MF-1]
MSPNIPLKTPIASSINVSGIKFDVGNLMAQTASTWTIPNISVTPIPLNPTNTQMHVSEGPGSKPELSSKANTQSKFPCDFLLNPRWNPVTSQEAFGPINSQPSIFHQDLRCMWAMKSDELYASLPLFHKEKVTRCHNPYASKPRTAHASSSREKTVDDEDKNMSPNHSKTNDEPRRDNFVAHEEGTQSNSEFSHPQIPLSQSMPEQSKIRQQRSQARKAHNVAKIAIQKE